MVPIGAVRPAVVSIGFEGSDVQEFAVPSAAPKPVMISEQAVPTHRVRRKRPMRRVVSAG